MDDDSPFWMVPTRSLARRVNPLVNPPWHGCADCSRRAITAHIANGTAERRPWDWGDDPAQVDPDIDDSFHASRVAFLVLHPDPHPVLVDVGVPALGFQPAHLVFDGLHRLAAAIYRGDPWLAVDFSGSSEEFARTFPKRRRPDDGERSFYVGSGDTDDSQVHGPTP